MSAIQLGIKIAFGQEEVKKVEMEIDLMQVPNPSTWQEFDFKVTDYTIKVDGKEVTLLKEDNVRNHKISMDKESVYLSNLGMYESKITDGAGITETRYIEIDGGPNIEKIQEDPNQKTKTYFLKDGLIQIGDKLLYDLNVDTTVVEGKLILSTENPSNMTGKLTLVGKE